MNDALFPVISNFRCPKKTPMLKTLLAILLTGAARIYASQDMKILEAISQVESSNMDSAVGKSHERGRWQISEAVWVQHSDEPFTEAHVRAKAQIVALKHLRWLRANLEVEDVGPWQLACAWKCGINYADRTETNEQMVSRIEYARRVLALYVELSK